MQQLMVGLDVGSTTVKAIVTDAASEAILWQDYKRHETRQPEKVLEFLHRMEEETGIGPENTRIFVTGSGGGTLAEMIGAKFVQEVHAVSLAVEKLHPEVYSVIELGGQDAKIIVFKDDEETGRKKKIPSMNDKCAGGTGAVIDKINSKLKIPATDLANQGYLRWIAGIDCTTAGASAIHVRRRIVGVHDVFGRDTEAGKVGVEKGRVGVCVQQAWDANAEVLAALHQCGALFGSL